MILITMIVIVVIGATTVVLLPPDSPGSRWAKRAIYLVMIPAVVLPLGFVVALILFAKAPL